MTEPKDDFFSSLENTKPFVKVAFEGFAGTGKTRTMAEVAIGLHQRIGSKKPIAVFDTEKAAMFLRRLFAKAGLDPKTMVLYKDSRTLADLKEVMRRGEDGAFDVLMIDSITHVWEDLTESYKREKKRNRLEFQDWNVLKPKWKREFSEPFVRHHYHALFCGRAGFEYEEETDPDTGKRGIHKTGIKMKAEGETAHEPDMLVLMERCEDILGNEKLVWREATVLKDRSGVIDGKTFKNPTYEDFAPAVDFLLENPVTRAEQKETQNTFDSEGDSARRKKILLEKIEGELVAAWPGQSAEAKRSKVDTLFEVFGTRSWREIQGFEPEVLQVKLEGLVRAVAARTGRAAVVAATAPTPASPSLSSMATDLEEALVKPSASPHTVVDKAVELDPDPDAETDQMWDETAKAPGFVADPDAGDAAEPNATEPTVTPTPPSAPPSPTTSSTTPTAAPALAASPAPPAPVLDAKVSEADFCARLGNDMADTAKLVCGLKADDSSGAVGAKVLARITELHGEDFKDKLWAEVGGQFTKGSPARKKPLPWGALRLAVSKLSPRSAPQDRAAEPKKDEPALTESLGTAVPDWR